MILASVIAMGARIKPNWIAVLLITLLGVGSVLAAWAMYDPHKHHPYRIALNDTLDWARSGEDSFRPPI